MNVKFYHNLDYPSTEAVYLSSPRMATKEIRHEHQRELIFCDEHEFYQSERYKEYRKAWNTRPRTQDFGAWPVNLDVSVTNACNLSCQMCKRTLAIEDGEAWRSGKFIDPN